MGKMINHNITRLVAILVLAGIIAACGGQTAPAYETISPASFSPDSPIPVPTQEVVLTLSGDITVRNVGEQLQLDMPTLERLGLVMYSISDSGGNNKVAYTGVLMSELIKFAGARPTATSIHMVALDQYEVDITFADIKKWPILLATRSAGEYMTVQNAGPTRIIFPFDTYPEIDRAKYRRLSIKNVKTMEFR